MIARYKIKVTIKFADVNHLRNKLFSTREESELNKKHIKELLKDTVSSQLERKRLNIEEFVETRYILTSTLENVTKSSRLEHNSDKRGHPDNIISIEFPAINTGIIEKYYNYYKLPKGNSYSTSTSTKPSYPIIS